jgi:RNA polymerase sigma-70 factor (ECF subfamily)
MTESEFIEGLKKGDEHVFRKFIDLYQASLLRLCNGFLHNTEDAKDVVQDVFIEVFQSVNDFRGKSLLSTWLYRIAINKSLNHIRKNKHKIFFSGIDSIFTKPQNLIAEISDESEIPDKRIVEDEQMKIIKKAIDMLPHNQRIAFILSKYKDLSYKDISEVMDISISATESLIHRAKLNLQKRLFSFYKKNMI